MSEDIVLGPPKTAFASASGSRNSTKAFDTPQRPSLNHHDDSPTDVDRKTFRDRHSKDGQKDSEQTRDPRAGTNQNRRSVRDDNGLWSSVRQQRSSGMDEAERPYRRNGDRDGQGGRENRQVRGFENHRRDGDRDPDTENGTRRTGLAKGRNEPSWYRDQARSEGGGLKDQDVLKSREWRDKERKGTRGSDRDLTKGGNADLDPEWMETPETDDSSGIHTQEDFERWKERMKSGNAVKLDATVEKLNKHNRTTSSVGTGAAKAKVDTPLIVDSSVDGFFGLWHQPKNNEAAIDSTNGIQPAMTNNGTKVPKPSKFTGFFNPKPDMEQPKEKPSLPMFAPSADSSNADKEGFQRILNLLGQQQQQETGKAEPSSRSQRLRDTAASPPIPPSRGVENDDLYSLLGSRSPPANPIPPGRDSDFLLKLMQQPQQQRLEASQESARAGQDAISGLPSLSNLMISPYDTPQQAPSTQPPPGFFDDMPIRDKLNPGSERRAPPPGIFDGNVPRQIPAAAAAPQQSAFPGAFQRPPGLDQVPSGYTQHPTAQRQNMGPPPGFSAPSRGQNAFPPGLVPNERLQFGVPTGGRNMPPPGFMHPAPPGFPVPFGQEGMPYGAFGDGGNFGRGGFPPAQHRR